MVIVALTEKRRAFSQQYLLDFNGKQAAIRAGYKSTNAEVVASRMLADPDVQEYISQLKKEAVQQLQFSRDEVLREIERIAFSDIRRVYDETGQHKSIHELDDDTAAAVADFDVTDGAVSKVKLINKLQALGMLAKYHGLFEGHQNAGRSQMTVVFDGQWQHV